MEYVFFKNGQAFECTKNQIILEDEKLCKINTLTEGELDGQDKLYIDGKIYSFTYEEMPLSEASIKKQESIRKKANSKISLQNMFKEFYYDNILDALKEEQQIRNAFTCYFSDAQTIRTGRYNEKVICDILETLDVKIKKITKSKYYSKIIIDIEKTLKGDNNEKTTY